MPVHCSVRSGEIPRGDVLRLPPRREGLFELGPAGWGNPQGPLPPVRRSIAPDPAIALEECSTAGQGRVLEAERYGERPDRPGAAEPQPDQHRELGGAQTVWTKLFIEQPGDRARPPACGKTVAGRAERQVKASGHRYYVCIHLTPVKRRAEARVRSGYARS